MDWLRMPPLSALRAFAALAETCSITAAGAALNVSHAAVSQQLRALESHLGVKLTVKDGRGVALTADGTRLAEAVTDGFAEMARAIDALTGADADRPLHVSMTPSFAASWLMPRLADFRAQHPEIDLMVNATPDVVRLEPGGIDLAIRFGRGGWQGLECERLFTTHIVIVGARALLGERQISDPSDLLDYPWLQELGTDEASSWLRTHGVATGKVASLTQMPGHLVLEGLRQGQGIVATTRAFVDADIAAGHLRVLFEDDHPDSGYWLVTRPGVQRKSLRAFASWLRRQAASS
ncbi:LysR family transcriptional regulator [Maritimibacter sp. 55A14]|uniref:LysR family transcriptional regulator n=1 Tax=Maritimibacter sp. 55A14 TaxID=2174844 RepID=UPI000D620081|nr:LysR family transcriptional regulator [Maritimibacter sp. 55A14]PWE32265.1 LysR family transcriptional regulator [Maritimibacter sp. 55A14]